MDSLEALINSEQKKYDSALKSYNTKVNHWNVYGGTIEEYYNLQAMKNDIDKKEKKLQSDIDKYNELVSEYNTKFNGKKFKINEL